MDREQFESAINANPKDFPLRLLYADWLEEQGDETAEGWRWMAQNGKVPKRLASPLCWKWLSPGFSTDKNAPSVMWFAGDSAWPTAFIALEAAAYAFCHIAYPSRNLKI